MAQIDLAHMAQIGWAPHLFTTVYVDQLVKNSFDHKIKKKPNNTAHVLASSVSINCNK